MSSHPCATHTTRRSPLCQISQNLARSRSSAPPLRLAVLVDAILGILIGSRRNACRSARAPATASDSLRAATHVTSYQQREIECRKSRRCLKSMQILLGGIVALPLLALS